MELIKLLLLIQTQLDFLVIFEDFVKSLADDVLHFDGQILLDVVVSLLQTITQVVSAVTVPSDLSFQHSQIFRVDICIELDSSDVSHSVVSRLYHECLFLQVYLELF